MRVTLHDVAEAGYHPLNAVGVPLAVYHDELRVAVVSDPSVKLLELSDFRVYSPTLVTLFERRTLDRLAQYTSARGGVGSKIEHVAFHSGGTWFAFVTHSSDHAEQGDQVLIGRSGQAPVPLLAGRRIIDCRFEGGDNLQIRLARGKFARAAVDMEISESCTLVTIPLELWSKPPLKPFIWRGTEARDDWPAKLTRTIIPRERAQRVSNLNRKWIDGCSAELHSLCEQNDHPIYPARWAMYCLAFENEGIVTGSSHGLDWWSTDGDWRSTTTADGSVMHLAVDAPRRVLVYHVSDDSGLHEVFRLHTTSRKQLDSIDSEEAPVLLPAGQALVTLDCSVAMLGPAENELSDVSGIARLSGQVIASETHRRFAVVAIDMFDVLGEVQEVEGGWSWSAWFVIRDHYCREHSEPNPLRALLAEPRDESDDIFISQADGHDSFDGVWWLRPGDKCVISLGLRTLECRTQTVIWRRAELRPRSMAYLADHDLLAMATGTELIFLDATTGADILRKDLGSDAIAVAAQGDCLAVTTGASTLRIFRLKRS